MKFTCSFLLLYFMTSQVDAQKNIPVSNSDRRINQSIAIKNEAGRLEVNDSAGAHELQNKSISKQFFTEQVLSYAPMSYLCLPYCDVGSPREWYILSCDIKPQFVIWGTATRFVFVISPGFAARLFHNNPAYHDSSSPIRTPSFMPGGTIYYPIGGLLNAHSPEIKYLSLGILHQSNGQDGPEFSIPGRELNHYNGNFSTNYLVPGFHFRKRYTGLIQTSKNGENAKRFNNELIGSAEYEFHFATTVKLNSSYGNHRFNVNAGWIHMGPDKIPGGRVEAGNETLTEKWRVLFNGTFIAGKRDLMGLGRVERRINCEASFYWRLPHSDQSTLYAAVGYYGSDPYNIFYDQSYFFARIGFGLGAYSHIKL